MQVEVNPKDVLSHMKATQSEWAPLGAFMKRSKGRKEPFSLGGLAEDGGVEFALWCGRMLPEDTHSDARLLAAAFAMGANGRFREIMEAKGRAFSEIVDALLGFVDGAVTAEDMCRIRLSRSAEAASLNGHFQDILTAAAAASAKSPWGGALVAASYARDAAAKLSKRKDERDHLCEVRLPGWTAVHARLSLSSPPPSSSVVLREFQSLVEGCRGEVVSGTDSDGKLQEGEAAVLRPGDVVVILRDPGGDRIAAATARLLEHVARNCRLHDLGDETDFRDFIGLSDRIATWAARVAEESYQAYLIRHVMG